MGSRRTHADSQTLMRLALHEPDMPPNVGTLLRLGACLGVAVDIIEPCGFPFSLRALRRYGLDYLDQAEIVCHLDFAHFDSLRRRRTERLIAIETSGARAYTDFSFTDKDILLLGSESAGLSAHILAGADACVKIPMRAGFRSLNVAVAAAMVLGEALRQTGGR